jgi:threonine/homoserine/homoserine lactone efflux protein
VVFFAALFPQFIDPAVAIWPQLLILGATYIAVDGTLLVVWGSAAARVLGFLRSRTRLLNRISGSLMILAAGLLALKDPQVERP